MRPFSRLHQIYDTPDLFTICFSRVETSHPLYRLGDQRELAALLSQRLSPHFALLFGTFIRHASWDTAICLRVILCTWSGRALMQDDCLGGAQKKWDSPSPVTFYQKVRPCNSLPPYPTTLPLPERTGADIDAKGDMGVLARVWAHGQ